MTDYSAWSNVTILPIIGSIDGVLTNYNMPITVNYNSTNMRSDFGDIRFTLEDGTDLEYDIENLISGDHCDFLVKIPSIPASPAITEIIQYSGNPAVTTTASPASMNYLFYDDGSVDNSSEYTLTPISGSTVNGTLVYDSVNKCYKLNLTADNAGVYAKINNLSGNNIQIEALIRCDTEMPNQQGGLIAQQTDSIDQIQNKYILNAANRVDITEFVSGRGTTLSQYGIALVPGNWYRAVININGTNIISKWYDNSGGLITTLTGTLDETITNGTFGLYSGWSVGSQNSFKNIKAFATTAHPPTIETPIQLTGLISNQYTDEDEISAYGLIGNNLYWLTNWNNSMVGHLYITNISTNVTTLLKTGTKMAAWGCVIIRDTLYIAGQENNPSPNLQSMIMIVKDNGSSAPTVTTIHMPQTDDCNELVSVDSDGTYLIVGERTGSPQVAGSIYQQGSGLW
jgi:hypothetical protein